MKNKFKIFPIVLTLGVVGIISGTMATILEISESNSVETKTKKIEVSTFNQLKVSGMGSVEVIQSDDEYVVVAGPANIVDSSNFDVTDNTLYINQNRNKIILFNFGTRNNISYKIYTKDLNMIQNDGISSITIQGLKTQNLEIINKGIGNIEIRKLEAESLSSEIEGMGILDIGGKVTDMNLILKGTGSFEGDNLQAQNCKIIVQGMGSADVNCSDQLDAEIDGMGDITYRGRPQVRERIKGLGSLQEI